MESIGLLILRLGIGGLMLQHGIGKLQKLLEGAPFPDLIGLGSTLSLICATMAEFGGALLVIVGLFTRFGAFSLVFTMAVAAFVAHANDPWFDGPGVEKSKEAALLYGIAFLAIVFLGAGKHSVDAKLQERKKSKTGI